MERIDFYICLWRMKYLELREKIVSNPLSPKNHSITYLELI